MKKIIVIGIIGLLLTISIATVNAKLCRPYIYVDDDADPDWYDETHVKTINEGISIAEDGDTVYVFSGTYAEHVVIDKSIKLYGQDKSSTFINQGRVTINHVSGVIIQGFTIKNEDGDTGLVRLYYSSDCIVHSNNLEGLFIDPPYCIELIHASNNLIEMNTINGWCTWTICGIYLGDGSDNNMIKGNSITECNIGIGIEEGNYNTVYQNTVTQNRLGIGLDSYTEDGPFNDVKYNKIIANNVLYNTEICGIAMGIANNNQIHHNNLIGNGEDGPIGNAIDGGINNKWYDSSNREGNYWDDYNGPDVLPPYGVGDIPYYILYASLDRFPLMEPVDIENVEIDFGDNS